MPLTATTLDVVDAMISRRIGAHHRSLWAPVCSAGKSALLHSPPRFRQPTTLTKYSGETDPGLWLNDYRLACQLGGATDDVVIIRNLPLHLADSARTWLEHLPANQIHDWSDLVKTFVGNFQGVAKMASHAIFQYNVLAIDDTHNTWTNVIVKMIILRLLGSSDDKN